MQEKFTHQQKMAYYKKRANDTSLTPAQRKFAQGFLTGADDSFHAYTYNTTAREFLEFMKTELPRKIEVNKVFVNPTYNGYGQGSVSVLQDMVEKLNRRDKK